MRKQGCNRRRRAVPWTGVHVFVSIAAATAEVVLDGPDQTACLHHHLEKERASSVPTGTKQPLAAVLGGNPRVGWATRDAGGSAVR